VSTHGKGIMEQIRDHLTQGRSSREVIDLGYAPGSVYKAQRQVRKRAADRTQISAQQSAANVLDLESEARTRPIVDDLFEGDLRSALFGLLNQDFPRLSEYVESLAESSSMHCDQVAFLSSKLSQFEARVWALEAEVNQTRFLTERVRALESFSADANRKMVKLVQLIKATVEPPDTGFDLITQLTGIEALQREIVSSPTNYLLEVERPHREIRHQLMPGDRESA